MRNFCSSMLGVILTCTCGICQQSQTNFFTTVAGDYEISVLCENRGTGNSSILLDVTEEMLKNSIPEGTFPNAVHAYLIRMQDKNVLVDTGFGKELFANLAHFELQAEDIDVILLTHMHGDHIGGMLKEGKPVFTTAQVYIAQPEYDYWLDDRIMNNLPEDKRGNFSLARQVLDAYNSRLSVFVPATLEAPGSAQVLSGIQAIAAYGHTPGHTMYLITSGNDKLLIWGDLTHAMAVQMPYPQVAVTYDVDPETAVVSRLEVLKYVAENKIPIAGMHVPFPGMGTVYSDSRGGYLFTPFK